MKTNKKPTKKYLKNLKLEVIERDGGCCVVCGNPNFSIHHVFAGNNRKTSNQHSEMMTLLCYEHHQGTNGVHGKNGHELDEQMKRDAQRRFEETHSRQEFMDLIGKNYLEDEE
jgi:5-methylcytosine-specific restriction endonuclease McrA